MSNMQDSESETPFQTPLQHVKQSTKRKRRSTACMNQDQIDEIYGYVAPKCNLAPFKCPQPRRPTLMGLLYRFFPVLSWLPTYSVKTDLLHDVVAGLTVGIMHIPQGMAYASLAGLDPVYGLYTSFFPSLFYVLFGTSRHVSMGTFAVASLMIGGVRYRMVPADTAPTATSDPLADRLQAQLLNHTAEPGVLHSHTDALDPVQVVAVLTFASGILQLLMGTLRLGFLTVFMSEQVIGGFTTGAAIMVFTAQIDKVFGITVGRYENAGKLYYTYRDIILALPETNIPTLVTSLICIIVIFLVKDCINARFSRVLKLPIPIDLIVIIISTAISFYVDFNRLYGINIVGKIPTGLPTPRLPSISLLPSVIVDAFTLAIITFSITVSMAKIFAKRHGYKVDPNQELLTLGAINTITSCLHCFACAGTMARSTVNENAGARSQIAGVIGSMVVLVVLLWVGPLFEALPKCVLASIIIVALKGMFKQFSELKELWPQSKIDFSVWLVSFLATFILDVTLGLLVSVLYAILTVLFRQYRPYITTLGTTDSDADSADFHANCVGLLDRKKYLRAMPIASDAVIVFRFDGPLYFVNCELFRKRLHQTLATTEPTYRASIKDRTDASHPDESVELTAVAEIHDPPARVLHVVYSEYPMSQAVAHADAEMNAVSTNPQGGATENVTNGSAVEVTTPAHALGRTRQTRRVLILDCRPMAYIDVMGAMMIGQVNRELAARDVKLVLACCSESFRAMLCTCKIMKCCSRPDCSGITSEVMFQRLNDAIAWSVNHIQFHDESIHTENRSTFPTPPAIVIDSAKRSGSIVLNERGV